MKWETVVGLEVHVQLKTNSKLFSTSSARISEKANKNICEVDLGFPGVLPVLNKKAVTLAVAFGLGINAKISRISSFSRKSYFYPDLPKGYQITQHTVPIIKEGKLCINLSRGKVKIIRINRAHLEEDAGKSIHDKSKTFSGIDFNRAGIALLEIVSEPDIRSPEEAAEYLKRLHKLVRYLKVSNGNMQEGSFRCDVNVSLRPLGSKTYGTRVEIKNLNSFKFVKQAIEYETIRQKEILEKNGKIIQQTRQFNEKTGKTTAMRLKEQACDYRYFPEPDLPPVVISKNLIDQIRKTIPELPWRKSKRFQKLYKFTESYSDLISSDLDISEYFEEAVAYKIASPKNIANWICGDVCGYLKKNKERITTFPISPKNLSLLVCNVENKTISNKSAKSIFSSLCKNRNLSIDALIKEQCFNGNWDEKRIKETIKTILLDYETQIQQYKEGKTKIFGFFVGKIMQETKGQVPPEKVNKILTEILQNK